MYPSNTEVSPDEIQVKHGTEVLIRCNDMCNDTRTCNDGTWTRTVCQSTCNYKFFSLWQVNVLLLFSYTCFLLLTFTAPRCPRLESTSTFNISLSANDPVYRTTATYSCVEGRIEGENISTCFCNGSWSEINPICIMNEDRSGGKIYRYTVSLLTYLTKPSLELKMDDENWGE